MHHTTSRDPGQVDTQQKTGFKYVKVKGQGQICEETPILTHYHAQCAGLPAQMGSKHEYFLSQDPS